MGINCVFYSLNFFFICFSLNKNNSFPLNFFTHKVILFRNQYKTLRRMVYNIITFGGTAQATIFHALEGVFRENAHAPIKASKFFGISRVHLAKIKSQTNWAVICTRKFPQRLDYTAEKVIGSLVRHELTDSRCKISTQNYTQPELHLKKYKNTFKKKHFWNKQKRQRKA